MKNTYKKHINIVLGSCIILVIGIIIGFVFSQHSTANNTKTQESITAEIETKKEAIADKSRCQKDGQEFYANKEITNENNPSTIILSGQRYIYNSELDTCLITWSEHFLRGDGYTSELNYITDIYTNKDIAKWYRLIYSFSPLRDENLLGSEEEFNTQLQHYGFN